MAELASPSRQRYLSWVEERIEEYKESISRDELLALADEAVLDLSRAPDGQYALTEIILRETVDAIIFQKLNLPTYRTWLQQQRRRSAESASG